VNSRILMIVLMIAALGWSPAGAGEVEPGVPLALAQARARVIDALRYEVRFRIPEGRHEPVEGRATIRLELREPLDRLVLDFARPAEAVRAVRRGGAAVPYRVLSEHLVLDGRPFEAGEHAIEVEFVAGDGPLNRQDDFLYTIFVPARAREAFPSFDQPDLKARFTLTLDLPAGWQAVSNGAELVREVRGTRAEMRFAETGPLPTYLFAFAAGRFSIESAERDGRTFRMFHRETDQAKLARNREAIFDLHASSLAWMERYTGIPYPWGKFDLFLAPAFQFGGMEHAGAIFYNAPVLLLEESATKNQLLGRASLIAHETAHMWFGDLVTMRWFDDVWMKEVFANFMAAKIVNPGFPEIDHELRFLLAHYPAAYDVDRTPGTNPIRQPLDNLNDAGSLYGAIIYQKAPIMMRQLERLIGEERLRDGLRRYLQKYAFANASWPDLIALLDEQTPEDLAAWSRAWVEEPGRPDIAAAVTLDGEGRVASLVVSQSDPRGRGLTWPQQLEVVVGLPDGLRTFPVRLSGERVEVPAARGLPAPRFVLPNGGGLAYGRVLLDEGSLAYLLEHLPSVPDALTRGSAWVAVWDELLYARVPPAASFDLALRLLAEEQDELTIQRVLSHTETLFWRFSSPGARGARVARLEAVLRDGLARAGTSSLKNAWFRTYSRVALTPGALQWLERVWRGDERVEGLTLSEPDHIALAQELAVREVEGWAGVLEAQQARIDNPDRQARFAFVRPALSADPAVRRSFFESLSRVEHRRREPWVLEALGYLHHPLRSESAEAFVPASLELLAEIRRTGDIFFPKRWLDATLSGHRGPHVAASVRRFLEANPDYPSRLRRIILQSADELFRAADLADPDVAGSQ
jgi:aminopeptidase N